MKNFGTYSRIYMIFWSVVYFDELNHVKLSDSPHIKTETVMGQHGP